MYGIAIRPGHQRDNKLFYKNNRPREISLTVNGDQFLSATLFDERCWQKVMLYNPIPSSAGDQFDLCLENESVYASNKYDDTCISCVDLILVREDGGWDDHDWDDDDTNDDSYDDSDTDDWESEDEQSIVNSLMDDVDFWAYHPDYEPAEGLASNSFINEDGSWTWWDFLRTSDFFTVWVECNGDSVPMRKNGWAGSEIVTYVPNQAEIAYYGYSDGWDLCEYNGYNG